MIHQMVFSKNVDFQIIKEENISFIFTSQDILRPYAFQHFAVFYNRTIYNLKNRRKKKAEHVLAHHGLLKKGSVPKFKIPSSDQLRLKRVDRYSLAANIRRKMTKGQRKALIKAAREET